MINTVNTFFPYPSKNMSYGYTRTVQVPKTKATRRLVQTSYYRNGVLEKVNFAKWDENGTPRCLWHLQRGHYNKADSAIVYDKHSDTVIAVVTRNSAGEVRIAYHRKFRD